MPHHLLVPVYTTRLSVQDRIALREMPLVRTPQHAAELFWKHLPHPDREHFCVHLLDTKNHVIGIVVVSVGDLGSCVVHPREVFKAALLVNAASIIAVHNHPSGDPTPSSGDIAVTRRLAEAGELLGVALLDHVVVGHQGDRYVSIKERGCF